MVKLFSVLVMVCAKTMDVIRSQPLRSPELMGVRRFASMLTDNSLNVCIRAFVKLTLCNSGTLWITHVDTFFKHSRNFFNVNIAIFDCCSYFCKQQTMSYYD